MIKPELSNRKYVLTHLKRAIYGKTSVVKEFTNRKELMTYLQNIPPTDILSLEQIRTYNVIETED